MSDLRERLARAICTADGFNPDAESATGKKRWQVYVDQADAALKVFKDWLEGSKAWEALKAKADVCREVVQTGPVPLDALIEQALQPPSHDTPALPGYHELKLLHELEALFALAQSLGGNHEG
ncbi:hypothetical protein [Henriciella pelagia]|uniref:hypothetical protein n=1 Tax=Henriciella pelagia TaxID=1977912 RepID=UPI00351228D7